MDSFERHQVIPIYQQISGHIKKQILEGKFKPLSKLPPERELAEEMGVNRETIRKALSKLCYEGLITRHSGKGTFVSEIENKVPAKKKNIGLVFPWQISNTVLSYYDSQIIYSLKMNLPEYCNLNLIYLNGHNGEEKYIHIYDSNNLDGMVAVAPETENKEELINMRKAGIPFVILGSTFRNSELDYIDCDNTGGTESAIEYLIKLGHKRIGFIGPRLDLFPDANAKFKGYKKTLQEHNLKFDEKLVVLSEPGEGRVATGQRGTNFFLELKPRPTAIFSNYQILLEVIRVIKERGLEIPDDISMIGFIDHESAEHLVPPLTTVRVPFEKMCKLAIEELLNRVAGRIKKPLRLNLKTELVIRESCASPEHKSEKLPLSIK